MSINVFIEELVDKLRSTLSFFSVSFNDKLVEALKKENDELKALKKENDYLGQLEQYWEAEVFSLKKAAKADAKIIQDFREKEKTWKYKAEIYIGYAVQPHRLPHPTKRQAHIKWLVDGIFLPPPLREGTTTSGWNLDKVVCPEIPPMLI